MPELITLELVQAHKAHMIDELTYIEQRHKGDLVAMVAAYTALTDRYTVFDQAIDGLIRLEVTMGEQDFLDELLAVPGKLWVDKLNALPCDPRNTAAKGFDWPDGWWEAPGVAAALPQPN
jgi:hypothetical protein